MYSTWQCNDRLLNFLAGLQSEGDYSCYEWTDEEEELLKNENDVFQRDYCESKPGFVFSEGDETKAPGCGTCWCCEPLPGEVFDRNQ